MSISIRPVNAARGVWVAVALLGPLAAMAQAPTVYRCPGPPVLYTDTLTPAEARSKNCKPLTDLPVAVAPVAPKPIPAPAPAPLTPVPAPMAASPVGTAQAGTPAGAAPVAGFVTPPPGGTRMPVGGAAPVAATGQGGAPAVVGAATAAGSATTTGSAAVPGSAVGSAVASVNAGVVALPDARVRPDDQRARDAEARRILEAELRREEARLSDALKASGSAKPGERVGSDAAQIRRAESDIEAIRRELGRLR